MEEGDMSVDRRTFLGGLGLGLATYVSPSRQEVHAAPSAARPNIIIIMADDMGYSDLGCYGSEIRTPNLDSLARKGLRFSQFYNTARCCPTRASLLTGLYSHQAGRGHMVENRGRPAYQGYLNDRCVTIGEALRSAGYRTMISGKWHVGENRPHWPVDRGFDRSHALISGGTNYFRLDPERKMAVDTEEFKPQPPFYITDWITDKALKMIDEVPRSGQPYFCYVAYTAPHWPLHAHPEEIARYRGKYRIGWDRLRQERHQRMKDLGLVRRDWPLTPRDAKVPAWKDVGEKEQQEWDLRMSVYAAQIDRMDQGVGRILAKVKERGEEQNTLVIFLADNGGCAEIIDRGKPGEPAGTADSFLSYGVGWANASNTPFRLYKHWVHEGGISTPLIACWPSVIRKGGGITHETGHLIDLMATCLDVAGADYPKIYQGREIIPLEGKSLAPIFRKGKREPHKAIYWEHEGNRAIRQGPWKLVSRYPGQWELYNLENDRSEMNEIALQNQDKVLKLKNMYEEWAKRAGVASWEEVNPKKK